MRRCAPLEKEKTHFSPGKLAKTVFFKARKSKKGTKESKK